MKTITRGVFAILLLTAGALAFVPGYTLSNVTITNPECGAFTGNLHRQSGSAGPYGADVDDLAISVTCDTETQLRVRVFDPIHPRWEPHPLEFNYPQSRPSRTTYMVKANESPFGLTIFRKDDGVVLFDSNPSSFNGLIFEDQYIEWTTKFPSSQPLYGLGERRYRLKLAPKTTYTIFNRGAYGTEYFLPLYGYHPFYLTMTGTDSNTKAHGVLMLNSNAMDVDYSDKVANALSFKMTGGIVDMFLFTGPAPADVVRQYHALIGQTAMPPYWALGWHQSRWGYFTAATDATVLSEYQKHDLPLDTLWNDIEYMKAYHDFTLDGDHYDPATMAAMLRDMHTREQHYVMILDPGIPTAPQQGYAPLERGNRDDVWIKDASGKPVRNTCWPGFAYFPDFTHPNATAWWGENLDDLNKILDFDGIWLDMNEPTTFCGGVCAPDQLPQQQPLGTFDPDHPPYLPGEALLYQATLTMAGRHHDTIHYNLHAMYGLHELRATVDWLQRRRPERRPFVLCRSTYPSSGRYGAHWTGDNKSTYEDMADSIPSIINMNFYGVDLVGADICGFNGETTEELCTRWMQLGSLYPFSRNHNSIGSHAQEPYAFGETLLNSSRTALQTRYQLLPYLYTQFWRAHTEGGSVAQPLFFLDHTDPRTYAVDAQFVLGDALLVSPALKKGQTTVDAYFPKGVWYDWWTGASFASTGMTKTLPAPLGAPIPMHVRGGTVLPTQAPAHTSASGRRTPFTLVVAPDAAGQASGSLHLDDGGVRPAGTPVNPAYDLHFDMVGGRLTTNVTAALSGSQITLDAAIRAGASMDPNWAQIPLGRVVVWGVGNAVREVRVEGATLDASAWRWDQAASSLTVNMPSSVNILHATEVRWM
eukprot:GAFH01000823.1.p1 GENE.GAFH01000823.1~~GAFH01000823.1.p1  ORF type:complete len:881 (-),score=284.11 GAFH01000823.1:103-2718(-)